MGRGRGSSRAVAPGEGVGRTGFSLWAPGEGDIRRAVALNALQPAACGLEGKRETPIDFTSKKTVVARLDLGRARMGSEPPRSWAGVCQPPCLSETTKVWG